jgi:hypothetical protein
MCFAEFFKHQNMYWTFYANTTSVMEKRVCSKLVSTENVPAPRMYYVPFLRNSFLLIPATCHCKTKYQQQHGCVCCSHFQMTHLPFTPLSLGLWPEIQILIKNVHADQLIFSLAVIWRSGDLDLLHMD